MMRSAVWAAVLITLVGVPAPTTTTAASKEPATVRLSRDDLTLLIVFENGQKLKLTSKGTKLAPGTHSVKSFRFLKKDEKNRVWELRSVSNLGGLTTITVAAGQEKLLDAGPPVGFLFWSRQGDGDQSNTVTTEVNAVGNYNEAYFPGAYCGGRKPPPPYFRAVSLDGRVLFAAQLGDRADDRCRTVWRVPAGFKGQYKVEFRPVMGPFKWVAADKVFEIK